MASKIKVQCHFCNRQFLTKTSYVVFNKQLGYRSFCSKNCEGEYRKTGKWLICSNDGCKKTFYRILSGISSFNYCSRSCSATINNKKFPKWPEKYCKKCEKPFRRGSPYCSVECGKLGRFKYTKEQMIDLIKEFSQKNNRIPAKREVLEISDKAANMFGSWNNTILAAGLTPNRSHDHRMYKRSKTKSLDGHICDSISEAVIDNWLHKNKIPHERNACYPNTGHLADWAINNGKIFIEYFGLAKDSPRYDREIKLKKKLCKKNEINLIGIYPKDLYPTNCLDKILNKLT
ncbi:MAG: hypothetical protein WD989_02525 [Candidatus Paceibacterota bacterium]